MSTPTLQTISGATATVQIAGTTVKLFQVALMTGNELLDVSGFGDIFKSYVQGVKDLSGTFTGYTQIGVGSFNPFGGATGLCTITFAPGYLISFTAISGKINYGADFEGKQTYTMEFANNNATVPVVTWPIV